MQISVILCTWNNSQRLAITLAAFAECVPPLGCQWELVVVNNNCTDDTDEVVARFVGALPLCYVKEPQQGLSRARNAGLAAGSGELIIFTDDDVRPCRQWLCEYWNVYQRMGQGYYFGGPIESEFEEDLLTNELLAIAPASVRGFHLGKRERELASSEAFLSANWACPKRALEGVNGFNVQLGLNAGCGGAQVGEENDLMRRLTHGGMKGLYVPACHLFHFVPQAKMSAAHLLRRADEYGAYCWEELAKNGIHSKLLLFNAPLWLWRKFIAHWLLWRYHALLTHSEKTMIALARFRSSASCLAAAQRHRKEVVQK